MSRAVWVFRGVLCVTLQAYRCSDKVCYKDTQLLC